MKKFNFVKFLKKIPICAVLVIALLLISVIFLWLGSRNTLQSVSPSVAGVTFQGEYKIADGEWKPIVYGEHISSTEGDVTLRGFFQMHDPTNNEPLFPIFEGMTVSLYFNHIGGELITPFGYVIQFDAEHELFGEDACTSMWGSYTHYGATSETGDQNLTIVLHNPHSFGNENAIDEFLENMSLVPGTYLSETMLERGESERNTGLIIAISALLILGIAVFSTIVHIPYSKEMWLVGLMSFFAGGYFLFDSFAVSFWNEPNIVNTRTLGLCMMLYILFALSLVTTLLKNKLKKIAALAVMLSGANVLCCIFAALIWDVKFYDTWFYWAIIECVICAFFIVCQVISFKGATTFRRICYITGILAFSAFILDFFATKYGLWEGGVASKHLFLVGFLLALVVVLRIIPTHINAAIKAKKLEAEQQALKLELQESRISIMLSQMQPHFIFNALNTIYHLCEINPQVARKTISSFSEYLRNNIDNLGQSDMIPFEKELSFVKTYLDIETVRFEDELSITYDISVTAFELPVLTVQPIVENAVKHGTSKKDGAAQLTIKTRETDTHYEITIEDTGVGFDTATQANDGHKHVGISNVKQRLENLCNGTLTIQSERGVGTVATIKIPKKEERKNENTCS